MELDQAWQAQNYGEKSQQYAEEEGDIEWQLNASVLVAQAQGMGPMRTTLSFPRQGRESCGLNLPSQCIPALRVPILRVGIHPCILTSVCSAYFKLSSVRAWGPLRAALPLRNSSADQHSVMSSSKQLHSSCLGRLYICLLVPNHRASQRWRHYCPLIVGETETPSGSADCPRSREGTF